MNKILVTKKGIISDCKFININNNIISFNNDGEYILEYLDNGEYNVVFKVACNVKLIECSYDRDLILNNTYIVDNGNLNVVKFYNNESANETLNIDLCSDGDKINYCFSNICRGIEKYIFNINHKHKNTISNISNKSITLKNSSLKFIINSNVYSECVKCVLNQNTRILTMGDSETSISPNMFIDLDDVEAKHGSVIGGFEKEKLFYLMSKGISYNDTMKLLIKGYLFSNLKIDVDNRMKIMNIIDTYWR